MGVQILKQGIIKADGYPNPNLFIGTLMDTTPVIHNNTDWTKYFRYYSGSTNIHSIQNGIDTITLNATSNLGIAFVRKATDINLDSSSYYTLSCEAKTTKTDGQISLATSYYNNSNTWVWRGGLNLQNFNSINTWYKFYFTFKPDADTQYTCYCFTMKGVAGGTDTFSIKNCKLEKGSVPTVWIPNENDNIYIGQSSLIENENNCKIQKNNYIQSNEFIEF